MDASTPLPTASASVEDLRSWLRQLRATMAYAFANAHGCSYGSKGEEIAWVKDREQTVVARIRELDG